MQAITQTKNGTIRHLDTRRKYVYTLRTRSRRMGFLGRTYEIDADSLRDAIRIARARYITRTWSLICFRIDTWNGTSVWKNPCYF